jgi:hypothetical protein
MWAWEAVADERSPFESLHAPLRMLLLLLLLLLMMMFYRLTRGYNSLRKQPAAYLGRG